jgi:hypothetical protein
MLRRLMKKRYMKWYIVYPSIWLVISFIVFLFQLPSIETLFFKLVYSLLIGMVFGAMVYAGVSSGIKKGLKK